MIWTIRTIPLLKLHCMFYYAPRISWQQCILFSYYKINSIYFVFRLNIWILLPKIWLKIYIYISLSQLCVIFFLLKYPRIILPQHLLLKNYIFISRRNLNKSIKYICISIDFIVIRNLGLQCSSIFYFSSPSSFNGSSVADNFFVNETGIWRTTL